jgi:hypothetical protein
MRCRKEKEGEAYLAFFSFSTRHRTTVVAYSTFRLYPKCSEAEADFANDYIKDDQTT